jgi:ribonuclease HI
MSPQKFYVVWTGRESGVFTTWDDCKKQVDGFEGAKYKSFKTEAEANAAFNQKAPNFFANKKEIAKSDNNSVAISNSLSVDAACSGNPGVMEYQGVHVTTKEVWFHKKFDLGTNNIGEFLAIVHGLAELNRRNLMLPVYTDSMTALSWVKKKKCGTKLPETEETKELFDLIRRAEFWLKNNTWKQPLLKWETKLWGEIPADFGRK